MSKEVQLLSWTFHLPRLYILYINSINRRVYTVHVIYIQYIRLRGETMEIILSNSSSKPIYEQIVLQIKEMIMNGELKANDPLPSMRKLAKDLHVSIITTQRAYDELSKDGFIHVIPAKGAFVSEQNKDFIREENLRRIEKQMEEICILAKQTGITKEEIEELLHLVYEEN